jgi:hypothetical protein
MLVLYLIIALVVLGSIGFGLYALISKGEQDSYIAALQTELREQNASYGTEINDLKAELAALDKIRHIPNVIAKSKTLSDEIAAKLTDAQAEADGIIQSARNAADQAQALAVANVLEATQRANAVKTEAAKDAENSAADTREAHRIASWQTQNLIEEAQKKAKEIASQARKEAKKKTQAADNTLLRAAMYAYDIRKNAEARAEEIGGQAYEASSHGLSMSSRFVTSSNAWRMTKQRAEVMCALPFDRPLETIWRRVPRWLFIRD